MATSQNGWPVRTTSSGLTALPWITGRVLPGPVYTIFDYLCRRFNAEVEPITVAHSWGWAYRAIRGASAISNHASATAIDLNAPKHPLGAVNTFSSADRAKIRAILRDLGGVVRWGGDYAGRKDEMHFEINASAAAVQRVASGLGTAKPATPQQEEPDMDATQATQLSTTNANVKKILDALGGLVQADGSDGLKHDTAHEWELKILRRLEARQIAQQAAPTKVSVDVKGADVAEALLEMLPKATATAVVDAMHARLAK